MSTSRKQIARDISLRVAGVLLLIMFLLLYRRLVDSVGLRHSQDVSLAEYLAAAGGFMCFSVGSALLMLGEHILDQVEVSSRWIQGGPISPPKLARGSLPKLAIVERNAPVSSI